MQRSKDLKNVYPKEVFILLSKFELQIKPRLAGWNGGEDEFCFPSRTSDFILAHK